MDFIQLYTMKEFIRNYLRPFRNKRLNILEVGSKN